MALLPLALVDDGAAPPLVSLPLEVVAAADEEAAEEDVRVALLMVVLRWMEVPVAALPLAPTPVPTTPVPVGAAVVELAATIGVVVVEFALLTGTPLDGAAAAEVDATTDEVERTDAELMAEVREALELEPPVKVIMPV